MELVREEINAFALKKQVQTTESFATISGIEQNSI